MFARGLLLFAFLAVFAPAARAATYTVNSTADTDDGVCNSANCTLREAINAANANPGTDTIRFVIGTGPKSITLLSVLPTITDPVVLDGTTQPGFSGQPIIELDGSSAGPGANGLRISGGGSLVTGLVINRFVATFPSGGGNGVLLEAVGGNEVRGCYIGTNMAGTATLPNGGDGILISNSGGNLVGRTNAANHINVISGNAGHGVHLISGASQNTIAGNRIGTNAAGTADLGNSISGVAVTTGSDNVIGSSTFGDTLLSGNGGDGVTINGGAGNVVQGCFIGLNAGGTAALANDGQGVSISGGSGNTIGPSNVVSGNLQSGVLLIGGASGSTVEGNLVGTDASGAAGVGNALNGIIVSNSPGNTIGPGNVVSGNGTNGVRLRTGSSGNVVKGNSIGVDLGLAFAIPNAAEGVQVNDGALNNTIGGPGADRNVISGNMNNGVLFADATTIGNVLHGNFIGTNATASAALPNGSNGVDVQAGASGNTVGGTVAGTKNVIAFNGGRGVFVESGTGNAVLGNTISYNGGLGIDLAPVGVTPNDPLDSDSGANLLQNFPVLSAIVLGPGSTEIHGSLNSVASTDVPDRVCGEPLCDARAMGPDSGRSARPTWRRTWPATPRSPRRWRAARPAPSSSRRPPIRPATRPSSPPASPSRRRLRRASSPGSGPAAGNTPVVILGANFQSPAAVRFGAAAASMVSVVSGAEVDAATPTLAPGRPLRRRRRQPEHALRATLPAAWLADFTDVPEDNIFHGDVAKIFRAGITPGAAAATTARAPPCRRQQMAVFLLKAEHGSGYRPAATARVSSTTCRARAPTPTGSSSSRPRGSPPGAAATDFCPASPVTRQQMAVFLLKTEHGSAYVPPTCIGFFDDVACPGTYTDWIEQLHAEQVTGGCQVSPPLYCPSNPVNRGQMATFLVKTFSLP